MLLDDGMCTIYTKTDVSGPGEKPRYEKTIKAESYYGRLSFETSPQWPTEHREETKIAERVRILQCRSIRKDDVAELIDFSDATQTAQTYKITRAFHGIDDDSGEEISDLSLEVMKP
ncbi:MAG: hypothetical protein IJ418_08990 [Clostridia bacterium]|nr:hypothetical protein [Clostridia bacterium]